MRENNACIDTRLLPASAVSWREYLEQNYSTLRRKLDQVRSHKSFDSISNGTPAFLTAFIMLFLSPFWLIPTTAFFQITSYSCTYRPTLERYIM